MVLFPLAQSVQKMEQLLDGSGRAVALFCRHQMPGRQACIENAHCTNALSESISDDLELV